MRVGIVGFSLCGKSTLFQALTGVAPDPAAALKGQIGIAKVADPRLDFLSGMFKPKKETPATVEFVDTPGLLRNEKGDNPQRLATLRTADGLMIVLDHFSSDEDPVKQLQAFREELLFADLELVSNRVAKLEAGSKKPKPAPIREAEEKELAEFRALADKLENGESIDGVPISEETQKTLKSFQLFSKKPELVVLNRTEDKVNAPVPAELATMATNVVVAAAKLELDLAQLDASDREMFMEELGVRELARDRIIRAAYDAVGLVSFFTVGEDECKAWTIPKDATAVEAAGKIHSDIARGFIRAELVAYKDLHDLGSMKEVKAKGLQRLEGKEYRVADGDIINFRFSV
ncbi:MAG: DUF933 domain-containing protein [Planctomycetota bacterium]